MSDLQILKVVKEMISQRGYEITEEDEGKILCENEDIEDVMCIFTQVVPKLDTQRAQEIICILHGLGVNHGVVIYNSNKDITPVGRKTILSGEKEIELFFKDDLKYNVTKHNLVPLHEKLDRAEEEKFRGRFKESVEKLPIIFETDRVSRFYNFKKGNLIRVTRSTKEGKFICYRLVK